MLAFCQNIDWEKMIAKCDPNTVFITQDFAMKWEPDEFRQSQLDWYGQTGITWEIVVFSYPVFEDGNWQMKNQVYVCIVDGHVSQDWVTVMAIFRFCCDTFAKANPHITKAWARSDNAVCYHSEATMKAMWSNRKFRQMELLGYKFSAASDGKSKVSLFLIY